MTHRLVEDPDPAVRRKVAELLYLFNAEAARPAAEKLEQDADPAVAEAARRASASVEIAYKQERLFGKR